MKKLVLIDGNSLLNRAFYATPVFSTTEGQPTNAIFGFIKLMFKIMSDVKPEYFIVTFDLKAPTFRHKMYAQYKANRSPMPEELALQVKPLKSLLSAMNFAIVEKEGLEADDLIGTLSKSFNVHSYIYTGDRDSFQLVDEKTDVYYTKRGVSDLLKLSAENFVSEVGLPPKSIVDLKALMGDKSDNIPGVSGVGETTARNLLLEYGSLDGVYKRLSDIKSPALRRKLESGRELAYLSYKLATINRYCDLSVDLEECKTPVAFSEEVKEMFKNFEFKTFMPLISGGADEVETRKVDYPKIKEVNSAKDFDILCSECGKFFIDLSEVGAKIYFGGTQYNVQCGAQDLFAVFSTENLLCGISKILSCEKNSVVFYDYKAALHLLGKESALCRVDDLSVMRYLVDFSTDNISLEELCALKNYDKNYCAYVMSILYEEYLKELVSSGEQNLYEEIERPLIGVLFDMERVGVKVDTNRLEELGAEYSAKLSYLSAKIFELCGCTFNINSPSQLGDVLFTKLGLKSGKKGKTGKYSTNAEVLEGLADESEAVRLILEYRQYQKLYSTYIVGFKPLIDKQTSLVHTTFNQTVTSTGRLSSANPNLQNIPVREEVGRELRKLFIPRDGNVLIDADYSQIELRLLAHFSGCKELITAYEAGADIHAFTASQVFGIDLNDVTPKMRRSAKAVNFGIIYGISEFGLSKNLGVDVKTARGYIEAYFARYSAVKEYMDENVKFAKTHGYVSTLTGRKRFIKEINSSNYNLRQFGERAAMNMPLQGSSADIIKIAMVNISKKLKECGLKTKLILQVHDELILDAPEDEADEAEQILKDGMENAVKLRVPLCVDVNRGKNWYDAK